jgi:aromatic ring hydroxylase
VLVPWERVFLLGDADLVNGAGLKTHASRHSAHQGAAKNLAKCELVLGVALLMTQTLSNVGLPHSEERLGELIMYTELMARVHAGMRGRRRARRMGRDVSGGDAGRNHSQSFYDCLSADG